MAMFTVMDFPPPVGYSYCSSGHNGNNGTCPIWNDTTAAEDNYRALQAFYELFPQLQKNDLYIAGESYAGVYVPELVKQILKNNANALAAHHIGSELSIPLKGFAIGDGCMGSDVFCGKNTWKTTQYACVKSHAFSCFALLLFFFSL